MFFKSFCLRALAALIATAMLLYVGVCDHESYDVKEPDACMFNFTVLSDVHIEGNNPMRYKVFSRTMQDIKKNAHGNDAVVFLGDSTMNGQFLENLLFHCGAQMYLRGENVLPVIGNHDVGNGQGDYAKLQNRWYTFTETFFGRHLQQPYYYDVVDGYYFIMIATQAQSVNEMVMTDEQFTWLEGVLELAAGSGKPTFIFAHHPAYLAADTDFVRTTRLIRMLTDFSREHDLFSFAGHLHKEMSQSSFRTRDGFPETYLPSLTHLVGEKNNEPDEETGVGVEVEVYTDEVVIRARSFFGGEWKTDAETGKAYEVSYALKNSPEEIAS